MAYRFCSLMEAFEALENGEKVEIAGWALWLPVHLENGEMYLEKSGDLSEEERKIGVKRELFEPDHFRIVCD